MTLRHKIYISLAAVALLTVLAGTAAYITFMPTMNDITGETEKKSIYIDTDDTQDSVCIKTGMGWRWNAYTHLLEYKVRTGRYVISPEEKAFLTFRLVRNGMQTPVRLTIPSVRTMPQLAARLSDKLMLDSATIARALTDSTVLQQMGYSRETVPALFIPNTYEIYWDTPLEKFLSKMQQENSRFWTQEREGKATALGMSHEEVATLASIVDEETANNAEKPLIAGMYLNRLRIGMPLQADPTVKFATGDFALRRIYNEHLKTESPYNTYLNTGLPPGPIRIPSIAGLDAVLNRAEHKYLYMCAKEDFSGTHNFAATYSEHLKNAARYVRALNARGIK